MKKFFASLILLFIALSINAIPARPGQKRTITLTDGTTVQAMLVGDEHGHFWQSADGRAFKKSSSKEASEQVDINAVIKKAANRRTQSNAKRAKRLAPRKVGEFGNYQGKKKGLIILLEYTDVKFQNSNTPALYKRIANEKNFAYGEFVGSVYDYFYAQSEGLFELEFDVVGPYTTTYDRAHYGGNDSNGDDEHAGEMIVEACKMADADVNYADYDWDGDGEVDQVFVLYAGNGEANYGDDDSIWPHEWELSSAGYYESGVGSLRLDGVKIDTYACSNELQPKSFNRSYEVTSWKIDGIGTICHEFSHCLGYPDFYDTNYKGPGMGYWDLMDSGSYNADGFRPAGFTSYERWVAGWKVPVELKEDTEVEAMKSLQEGGESYIIYNDGNKNEYFLLENRRQTGWDEEIPGEGLLILHVDYSASAWQQNTVNNSESHQRMTWIAADNKKKYDTYEGSRYYDFDDMANDPYPYNTNNSFTNTSKPAAQLFNNNTDGKKLLNKSVTGITRNADGTISFNFKNSAESQPEDDPKPSGSGEFKRITSTSQLSEDAEYLIVYEASETSGTAYAGLNTSGKTHFGSKVDVAIDGYTINNANASVVKLEKAGSDWYIKDGSKYLYYKGSDNSLSASESNEGTGYEWTITTTDITNTAYAAQTRKLQYNKANNGQRFACYKGTQEDVVLYMKTSNSEEPKEKKEPELSFSATSITVEAESTDFTAPTLNNPNGLTVVYSSDNEQLATVNATTGKVTIGATPGTVVITASFAGNDDFKEGSASYTITITEKVIVKKDAEIAFATESVTVEAGTEDFEEPALENPNNLTVSYSSDNELLATVDATTGEVTIGDEPGTVVITATFAGDDEFNEATASYTITITEKVIVKKDAEIAFATESVTVEAGTEDFEEPTLDNPYNLTVTYSSDNERLATVNAATGEVTIGTEPGTVVITATFEGNDEYNEATASYTITITEKVIVKRDAEIAFATESVTVEAGTEDFEEPTLENPNNLTVAYSSDNEQLATVDATTGEVTIGNETGTVVITATFLGNEEFNEATASYTITITEVSGIAALRGSIANGNSVYDLQGRKISIKPDSRGNGRLLPTLSKGIYIVNGRKVSITR